MKGWAKSPQHFTVRKSFADIPTANERPEKRYPKYQGHNNTNLCATKTRYRIPTATNRYPEFLQRRRSPQCNRRPSLHTHTRLRRHAPGYRNCMTCPCASRRGHAGGRANCSKQLSKRSGELKGLAATTNLSNNCLKNSAPRPNLLNNCLNISVGKPNLSNNNVSNNCSKASAAAANLSNYCLNVLVAGPNLSNRCSNDCTNVVHNCLKDSGPGHNI